MTIILFLAVLVFLILIHELGHFLAAKWAKMRVDEFAIGFPPRIFSFKKGETEYSLNLLPIGGYVKIWGENGDEEGSEGDKARAFSARPRLHQAIVLAAGVAMNILTAWVIFFAIAMIGYPTQVREADLATNAKLTVTSVVPDSPAAEAKIPLGAVITNIRTDRDGEDGHIIDGLNPTALISIVAANPENQIILDYVHKGKESSAVLTPKSGLIESEPDRKAIGLTTTMVEVVRQNPIDALGTATVRTYDSLYAITVGVFTLLAGAVTLSADMSQVAGPVGIVGMVGDAAEFGFVSLLVFTALISLNLAVINLLPIPALDGGRLVFVAIESIIRRPINPEWQGRVNLIGFALLIALMIAVTYNDILRLF